LPGLAEFPPEIFGLADRLELLDLGGGAMCSRDVYSAELRLSLRAVLRVARGIASAAAHLHARGILHGDLYAHNVPWDGREGEAGLGDFGAASFLPLGKEARLWQQTEIRAWGLLLDELLERCSPAPAARSQLHELVRACVQPDTMSRPIMADVAHSVKHLWRGSGGQIY